MSRLRALAEKLLQREHGNEHAVNTPHNCVRPERPGVNTHLPSKTSGLGSENVRVHVFIPQGREQMNTLARREHANEHGVNNECRHCREPIDWRRGLGLAFADGTVAHLVCDNEVEIARVRPRAGP